MIYLVILILLIFLSYRYDYRSIQSGRKVWIWVMLVIFILVAGLRYRLGADTVTYMYFYEILNPINQLRPQDFNETRFAPGFIILESIFRFFTDDFTAFQLFHAVVVCGAVWWFLYRNCRHFFFAVLIFYLFLYALLVFQQMRESMAVAVFLLAWPAFRDGKWIRWYVASSIAMLFHISSLMMFFLPLLCLPGVRQFFVFGTRTWIFCIAVFLFGMLIQSMFFKYIELIAFTESMSERTEVYSKNELSGGIFNIGGIIGMTMKYIFYPILAMYFIQKSRKQSLGTYDNRFRKEEFMSLMSVYVSIFTICVAIVSRYNNYFFIFSIVLMSDWAFGEILLLAKYVRLRFVYWVVLFLPMFGFQIHGTYLGDVNKSGTLKTYMMYYPYNSLFNNDKDKDREDCYRYKHVKGW